jgi:hypothetical protein
MTIICSQDAGIEEGFLTYVTRRAKMRREEKAGSLRFGMTARGAGLNGWRQREKI